MPNQTVQIRAALLVDGISTSAKTDQAILVTDGRIAVVGHQAEIAKQTPEVGFTPAEALISATRISAEAIGMADEIGTIAPGKIADLVAFAGDPTDDVGAFSRVTAVFQAGQRVK